MGWFWADSASSSTTPIVPQPLAQSNASPPVSQLVYTSERLSDLHISLGVLCTVRNLQNVLPALQNLVLILPLIEHPNLQHQTLLSLS